MVKFQICEYFFCECALKIALTRSIFQPKMHQSFKFWRPGSARTSCGSLQRWIKGPKGEGKERGGKRKGRGGGRESHVTPHDLFPRRPCSGLQHCDLVIRSYHLMPRIRRGVYIRKDWKSRNAKNILVWRSDNFQIARIYLVIVGGHMKISRRNAITML